MSSSIKVQVGDFDPQKRRYALNGLLWALFVSGAVAAINIVSTRVYARLDLTRDGIYSLSPVSRELVRSLPDHLRVRAFISSELPPELRASARYLRDVMDEYRAQAPARFQWEAIDPATDKKVAAEAHRCKVKSIRVQVIRDQKFEVGEYYLGACLEYAGKVEAASQLARRENVEYQISTLIKRLTQHRRKIAFTTGRDEADPDQGFAALKPYLDKEFDVVRIDPALTPIGPEVDALVVGGPKRMLDDKGQAAIDAFITSGKGAVLLVDGMGFHTPGSPIAPVQMRLSEPHDAGLGRVLAAVGFQVNHDFVFDDPAMPGPAGGGLLQEAPMYLPTELGQMRGASVMAGIRGLIFPYASSVTLVGPLAGGKPPAGIELWPLVNSRASSWRDGTSFIVESGMKFEPTKDRGPFTLAYAYRGPYTSGFGSGQAPKPVRLVVVGDSDFARDEYTQLARALPTYLAGAQLLLNAIGWVAEDESLAALRAKTAGGALISPEFEARGVLLQWVNVVGLPVAFCLLGIIRWRIRRRRRLGLRL